MAQTLTKVVVRALPAPATGNRIHYDDEVRGFGVRVTYKGAKAFVLNYRAGGRDRRLTIGSHPDWTVQAAREEAKKLKRRIDVGEDPMAERHAERGAPTVAEVADRFMREHAPSLRPKTRSEYASMLRLYVVPEFGKLKVSGLTTDDVKRLHDRVKRRFPYRANRLVALVAAVVARSGERADSPARGVKLCPEEGRERFLSEAEIGRVCDALDRPPNQVSADALRLLMLTGAREMEALGARWREFALGAETPTWTKPAATMKARRKHPVPLADAAVALLSALKETAEREGRGAGPDDFVFPGDKPDRPLALPGHFRAVHRPPSVGRLGGRWRWRMCVAVRAVRTTWTLGSRPSWPRSGARRAGPGRLSTSGAYSAPASARAYNPWRPGWACPGMTSCSTSSPARPGMTARCGRSWRAKRTGWWAGRMRRW